MLNELDQQAINASIDSGCIVFPWQLGDDDTDYHAQQQEELDEIREERCKGYDEVDLY